MPTEVEKMPEVHLLLCPQDNHAQQNAAEYIKNLNPAKIHLAAVANTQFNENDVFWLQDFYDTITGNENPDSLPNTLRRLFGKDFKTIFELTKQLRGETGPEEAVLAALETLGVGSELQNYIPYYQLATALKDTKLPLTRVDALQDKNILQGQPGRYEEAIKLLARREKSLFDTENGVDLFLEAAHSMFDVRETDQATCRKNFIRVIRKLPSILKPGESIVIVTDDMDQFSLRKEQPTKELNFIVRNFASLAIKNRFLTDRDVFHVDDYSEEGIINSLAVSNRLPNDDKIMLRDYMILTRLAVIVAKHLDSEPRDYVRQLFGQCNNEFQKIYTELKNQVKKINESKID